MTLTKPRRRRCFVPSLHSLGPSRDGPSPLGSRLSGWLLHSRETLSYAGEVAVGVISWGLRDRGGDMGLLGQGGSTEVLQKGKGTDKHAPIKGKMLAGNPSPSAAKPQNRCCKGILLDVSRMFSTFTIHLYILRL